jgi:hypothetical protein
MGRCQAKENGPARQAVAIQLLKIEGLAELAPSELPRHADPAGQRRLRNSFQREVDVAETVERCPCVPDAQPAAEGAAPAMSAATNDTLVRQKVAGVVRRKTRAAL